MTGKARPAKIHVDELDWVPAETAVTKVRIKRLITRGRQGSELNAGYLR